MRIWYWSSYVCSSDLGERAIPCRIEPTRAMVEAFGGDRDIVGVEHAVNKARRHVGGDEARCPLHCMVEQAGRGIITARPVVQQMLERIIGKTGDVLALPQIGEALEAAVADKIGGAQV